MPTNDEIVSQSIPVKVTFVDVPEVTCVKLGPVVEIVQVDDKHCHGNCDLHTTFNDCKHQHENRTKFIRHTDTCPGPAPDGFEWRLCLVAKDDFG